jgi:glycosyltransferase involved in cell wall biosynthesis
LTVTVAIPVRDGGELLRRVLESVRAQRLEREVELIVCDSGSRDGSVGIARNYGAEVIAIAPETFSHGGTRNLLMERSRGEHVAFLTQDAVPVDERWLARLLGGFSLSRDVALVFGPYKPRANASPMVARELTEWFRSLSPDGQPRIDRLDPDERGLPAHALLGPRGFFTDANGCVARSAWEQVPFRPVSYAEDHALAHDMLGAGFSKVYVPEAAVIHSHEYSGWDWLRRSFDEARAMNDVYGFSEQGQLSRAALNVWGQVGADWRWLRSKRCPGWRSESSMTALARSLRYRLLRTTGTMLGVRARQLPEALVKLLSLEGRGY